MTVCVVCEGSTTSLDRRVLDGLLGVGAQLPVEVHAAGGASGLGSVARYLEAAASAERPGQPRPVSTVVAISVADRDYRPLATAEASWADSTSKAVIWRRHQIENYLLEPAVVLSTIEALGASVQGLPRASLPTDIDGVRNLLAGLAAPLLSSHAGHLVSAELRQEKAVADDTRWRDPRPEPAPGQRHADALAWLAALQDEADRVKAACRSVVGLSELDRARVAARFEQRLAWVTAGPFIDEGLFLHDLSGKSLLAELHRELSAQRVHLTRPELENELVSALLRCYGPGLFEPDDYAALANRVRDAAAGRLSTAETEDDE